MIRVTDRKIRDLTRGYKKEMRSQKEQRRILRTSLKKAEKRLQQKNKFNIAARQSITAPAALSSDETTTSMSDATYSPPPPPFPRSFVGVVPGETLQHPNNLEPYIREESTDSGDGIGPPMPGPSSTRGGVASSISTISHPVAGPSHLTGDIGFGDYYSHPEPGPSGVTISRPGPGPDVIILDDTDSSD